jgi:hypothetical protein
MLPESLYEVVQYCMIQTARKVARPCQAMVGICRLITVIATYTFCDMVFVNCAGEAAVSLSSGLKKNPLIKF